MRRSFMGFLKYFSPTTSLADQLSKEFFYFNPTSGKMLLRQCYLLRTLLWKGGEKAHQE